MPVPAPAAPKLCLGLWKQLGEASFPGKGRGFVIPCKVPAYLPAKPTGLFFPEADLRPRLTLHCWKGQREGGREGGRKGASSAKVRFWQLLSTFTVSASTGMKVELNPAYLKSEGKGYGSGRHSYLGLYSHCLLPIIFWVCFRLKELWFGVTVLNH